MFIIELQVDNKAKDPDVKLIYQDNTPPSYSFTMESRTPKHKIIITKLSLLDDLVAEMKRYRLVRLAEKEAKKIAKS